MHLKHFFYCICKHFSGRKVRICNISPTEWIGKKDLCHLFGNDLVLLPMTELQLTSTGNKIGLYGICRSKFLYGFHIFISYKCKPSSVTNTMFILQAETKMKVSHFLNEFFHFMSWFFCFKIWVSFVSFGILWRWERKFQVWLVTAHMKTAKSSVPFLSHFPFFLWKVFGMQGIWHCRRSHWKLSSYPSGQLKSFPLFTSLFLVN